MTSSFESQARKEGNFWKDILLKPINPEEFDEENLFEIFAKDPKDRDNLNETKSGA